MDPVAQLLNDRRQAREQNDPCANLCTAASVDANNVPHARTLVLRDIDGRLGVFVNATSPKFAEITHAGQISVVVWLPSLSVQYRLQCAVEPIDKRVVDDHWQLRPDAAKRLDWYYTTTAPQSSAVASRRELLQAVAQFQAPEHAQAPRTAVGFYLLPRSIDRLHLAEPGGIHDRRAFVRQDGQWQESVVVP